MKKLTVILLCGMLAFSMGCGADKPAENPGVDISSQDNTEESGITEDVNDTDDVENTTEDENADVAGDSEDTDEDENDSQENEEADEADEDSVSIADIYNEIGSSVALVSPMEMPEDFIYNYYGIDTSAMKDYVFVISEEATSAETIIIVNAGADGDTESIKASLETLLSEKANEMNDYLPDEYDIVVASSVQVKGHYVTVVVSHSADEIQAIIDKYIN